MNLATNYVKCSRCNGCNRKDDEMAQISTRKRGNTWEYSFEIGKINGKRKRMSKGGFRRKNV